METVTNNYGDTFRIGMKVVRRTGVDERYIRDGEHVEVSAIPSNRYMRLVGYKDYYFDIDSFSPVKEEVSYPNAPHAHADLIKAWADGAVIQVLHQDRWLHTSKPVWTKELQYRIKPEEVEDKSEDVPVLEKLKSLEEKVKKLAQKIVNIERNVF